MSAYTLSSYDPVPITVHVPYVTEHDVRDAMVGMVLQQGGTEKDVDDAKWVKESLEYDSLAAFEAAARHAVQQDNEEAITRMAEASCLERLAERLQQDPDQDLLKRLREDAAIQLKLQLDQARMSLKVFMSRNNLTVEKLNEMLDRQALTAAREQAALIAYADHMGLEVEERELSGLLNLPEELLGDILDKARRNGTYESYLLAARGTKALSEVAEAADVTIVRETKDEALALQTREG